MKTSTTLKNTAFSAFLLAALAFPAVVNAEGWKNDKVGASTNVTSQNFAEADVDKSGTLSENEYDSYADDQEKMGGLDIASDFDDLDKDNNDTLTVAEFTAQKADGKGVNDNQ